MKMSRFQPLWVWLSVATAFVVAPACDDADDGSNKNDDDDDDDDEGEGDEPADGIGGDDSNEPEEDGSESAEGPSGDTCEDGEFACDGASIEYCDGGELQTATCSDVCGQMGYTSSGCDSQDGCLCDGLADQECATGASAMCTCFEWAGGEPCSDDAFLYLYDSCWNGSDEAPRCVEDYVVGNEVDCEAAYACLE